MTRVPQRPGELSAGPVKIGYAPSAGHWYSIARTLNWLHGAGGCCIPWTTAPATSISSQAVVPVALRSRPATTHRLWIVRIAASADQAYAEFEDFSGVAHPFQVAASAPTAFFYFLESCGAQDADMGVQTGTIGIERFGSAGSLSMSRFCCYDLARPQLDQGFPDFGVVPPPGASPIVDSEGQSAGGIAEGIGYARRHAARIGLFGWSAEEADAHTVSSGGQLFLSDPLIMPRRVGDSTVTGVTAHVRARLSGVNPATLEVSTSIGADSDSTSISSTSWDWYTLGPIDASNEDSTANADHGARAQAPFGETISFDHTAGDDLEIAAVFVTESPASALDMWTQQRLGEDDVELWLDAEHLVDVASGDVTGWTCPITGRAATVSGTPAFDGPDSGYANRSVVDFDDATPDYLTFAGGSHFDPTADGLTVYLVGEWDNAAGASDYLMAYLDSGEGWALRTSGGLTLFAYDGGGTFRQAVDGTSAPSGPQIVRASFDGNSGTVTIGVRVGRGSETTTSLTGYMSVTSADLTVFRYLTNGGNGKLASLFIVNRHIADGSDEDDRIMTALEARFGL